MFVMQPKNSSLTAALNAQLINVSERENKPIQLVQKENETKQSYHFSTSWDAGTGTGVFTPE